MALHDAAGVRERVLAALPGMGFTDYLRHMAEVESAAADAKRLRVAVLRSYTAEPIEPVLKLRFLLDGYRPSFWFGGYGQYVQEVMDGGSELHRFRPDLILLLVRIEELLPDLVDEYASRPPAEWRGRVEAAAAQVGAIAGGIEKSFAAQLVVQNVTLPASAYFGAFDAQQPDGQRFLVDHFNASLSRALADRTGAFVWDFDRLVRARGLESLHDAKQWYVARNPYKQSEYPAIAGDLYRYIRSALGKTKKCVVVDLDNTLWGGVAGEDGMEGIALGHTYPGNCYRDFQKELLKLYHRGILLAINSKNNEDDALRIIETHPDMVLRRKHFAAMRINWRDKATNIRELARELNIGVDSFIFLDDNPVECERVRQECPGCDVVRLPEKPWLLPRVPGDLQGVDNVRLTEEDRQKGEMYRAQAARQEHEEQFSNLDDFLRSLEVRVQVRAASAFSIPRIAQLTQKTNQLNMTTRRYTEAQVQALANDPDCLVYSVASRDRFGDDGIIGVFILRFAGAECRIDTFLLSCRVIGKGIEQVMVASIADLARQRGCEALVGEFFPTAKNQPAAGLYEKLGFVATTDTAFRSELRTGVHAFPTHVTRDDAPAAGLPS